VAKPAPELRGLQLLSSSSSPIPSSSSTSGLGGSRGTSGVQPPHPTSGSATAPRRYPLSVLAIAVPYSCQRPQCPPFGQRLQPLLRAGGCSSLPGWRPWPLLRIVSPNSFLLSRTSPMACSRSFVGLQSTLLW
jgi:hypothetical protein